MQFTFPFLGAAIIAVWMSPIRLFEKQIPFWTVLLAISAAFGVYEGILTGVGVVVVVAFCAIAYYSVAQHQSKIVSVILSWLTGIMALALAMHLIPGFHNPILFKDLQISPGAIRYTQYLNFDKGVVGLVLLAFISKRVSSWSELGLMLKKVLPVVLITLILVIGLALIIGYVKPDVKFSNIAIAFVFVNLLFTCVAEEVFFRSVIQENISVFLQRFSFANYLAIFVSALLFGAVHAAGGSHTIVLATLAGCGNAIAYSFTKKIEGAIVTHFALNTVQFVAFTYPHLL